MNNTINNFLSKIESKIFYFRCRQGWRKHYYLNKIKQLIKPNKMKKMNLDDAIDTVCESIKKDKDVRIAWEANIAMAFKDQFYYSGHKHDPNIVHEVANKAAAAFLDQLIGKDMGDVDGMAAVAKLHQQAKPLTL